MKTPGFSSKITNASPSAFLPEELLRYSRQLTLREVGLEGQKRLKAAKVLCVGAGGLGSPLLLYLAAAGIGTLGIIDDDTVEVSNLQRQILYSTSELSSKKLIAAKRRLLDLNPYVEITTYDQRLNHNNALELINQYDVIVDGTDNFEARYLINDACFHLRKPHIYASIFQFEGQCSVFSAPDSSCYRCLYADPPPASLAPNCAEAGVLGVLPGLMGSIQAMEVLKLILGIGSSLIGRLLLFDGLSMRFRELSLAKNPACLLCTYQQPFDSLPFHSLEACQPDSSEAASISAKKVQELMRHTTNFTLLDVRDQYEHAICSIGGCLIPLAELPHRFNEIDIAKPVIVYCKSGERSKRAANLLKAKGFNTVFFLLGGIMSWIEEIDPHLPRY